MLRAAFFPEHSENRMKNEGDVKNARERFFREKPSNLTFLLSKRYEWMNEFANNKEKIIEIGSGAGFSRQFILNNKLRLTDFNSPHDWIDENVDALDMPYADNSLDIIISSHMIHHLATPVNFFSEVRRVLKPGGLLLIHDVNTSFLFRFLLRVMHHEGYSYDVDVFDKYTIANNPNDPWSANCAIPELLFSNPQIFHDNVPGLKIVRNEPCEFLIFPISGGVISKVKTINLPYFMLHAVSSLDRLLIWMLPSVFAFGRRVVIEKVG